MAIETTMTGERAPGREGALEQTLGWIELLASTIGPRRPTGDAERRAAETMVDQLARAGLQARLEPFRGYASFIAPYGPILALACAPALMPWRWRRARTAAALAGAAGALTEGGLVRTPLSSILSRRPSQNVTATIEPTGQPRRTLCLVCHLDSSRGGLMFHPRVSGRVPDWIALQSAAVLVQAAEPVLAHRRAGRRALAISRAIAIAGLALLLERELRGQDAPGANDNASGAAVAARLAVECAAGRPGSTRVVLLMTGCEESGLLGAQAFLRSYDTRGWLFLNFDGVGGPATLRYLRQEGVGRKWPADPALVAVAEEVARQRTELGLEPAQRTAGLTYDVTPVLARGGRALTLSAQDRTIPNYHWPTDTYENIVPDTVARALEVGREMIAAIDRGEADR